MACYNIMAVLINHRTQKAVNVQEVFTRTFVFAYFLC